MLASSSQERWLLAAVACVVIGVILKLVDLGSEAPAPPLAPAVTTAAQRIRAVTRDPGDGGGADTARDVPVPGDAEFPTILRPGFHPDRPSAMMARRTERALARGKLRKMRREARLRAKRERTLARRLGRDEYAVPDVVVRQGERYPTSAPAEAADLAEKLGGLTGSVSLWLQPQWWEGNQDDATLVEIADGQLRLVKNVNFLRLEFMDDEGAVHALGAPITEWKTGEWHQVAGSWEGITFQLYFDGELVREMTIDSPFFLPEKPRMVVGSDFGENRPVAPGMVGGLEVRPRPLSQYEVMKRFVEALG